MVFIDKKNLILFEDSEWKAIEVGSFIKVLEAVLWRGLYS